MTCKARLEEAGVGWVVLLWHDLADVLDRDAAGDVKADLVGGGLVTPDGSLTARGEEARRAALRLLAERQVSPARIEALAGGDVARWAALADAATPGPWEVHGDRVLRDRTGGDQGFDVIADITDSPAWEHDAAFIAATRTAVPALCAEVARLRAVVEAYQREDGTIAPSPPPAPDGLTVEQRERVGYVAALVQASSFTCITGRPEDAARAFAGLLGAAGESEDGRRGAARALRHLAAVLEGQPVPATTAEQDVHALEQEAKAAPDCVNRSAPDFDRGWARGIESGIRRALDVLAPHLPPPRGAR